MLLLSLNFLILISTIIAVGFNLSTFRLNNKRMDILSERIDLHFKVIEVLDTELTYLYHVMGMRESKGTKSEITH